MIQEVLYINPENIGLRDNETVVPEDWLFIRPIICNDETYWSSSVKLFQRYFNKLSRVKKNLTEIGMKNLI